MKVQNIEIGALQRGTYTLRVDIEDDLDGRTASRSGVFQITGSDDLLVMPMDEEDIAKYYDQIKYIATEEQLALFRKLARIGKQNFLLQFWRSKYPTPETPENEFMIEHFRRIAYAEEHFTGHKGGINTDMGRVYIVYGSPEEIERESREAKAYEMWYYSLRGRKYFVFVDQTGTGVYVLVHSSAEGEIHNPYWRDEIWR